MPFLLTYELSYTTDACTRIGTIAKGNGAGGILEKVDTESGSTILDKTPNAEKVHVRKLGMEDYDRLLILWRQAGLHSLRPRGRDSRASLARQLASGVQTILGLEVDGHLVGAVVATHDSRKGWINRLAVHPDHRRRGYGTRLITAAEQALRDEGMRVIAALIESDNPASLALFQQAGYVEIDTGIHYLTKRDSDDA